MLPVILAAADDETRFCPDDLRMRTAKPVFGEAGSHRGGMEGAMPDIGDLAGEQRPRVRPSRRARR